MTKTWWIILGVSIIITIIGLVTGKFLFLVLILPLGLLGFGKRNDPDG